MKNLLELDSIVDTLLKSVFLLTLIILSQSTYAQSTDASEEQTELQETQAAESESTLTEVIVSASRIPVSAEKVGSSVTVFDEDDIESRQTQYVYELLQEVPGVSVTQSGGHGSITNVRIRGAESNHTLYVIDGIELNDPGNAFQIELLPISSIERVEVLRGPQSSIYGSEAIGGVVSLTTPTPKDGYEASTKIEAGPDNYSNSNLYFGYGDGKNYATLAHNFSETEGSNSRRADDSEMDGYRNSSTSLKLGTSIENLELSANLIEIDADSEWDPGDQHSVYDRKIESVKATFHQNDGQLSHSIRFSDIDQDTVSYRNGMPSSSSSGSTEKIEYQGIFHFNDSDDTLVFALEEESSTYATTGWSSVSHVVQPTRSYTFEYQTTLSDKIFLSLSGRHDDNSKNKFKNYNTYRGSFAFLPGFANSRVHGSISTGVKTPSPIELYGWNENFIGNPDLTPETSTSWEIGYEFPLVNSDMIFDVTYFSSEVTDRMGTTCVENCDNSDYFDNINMPINQTGVNDITGVELTARGVVFNDYKVSASLSNMSAKDPNGQQLIRRPSTEASLNINRAFRIGTYPGEINLNVLHTGKQYDNDYITWTGRVELDDYTLVNLSSAIDLNENTKILARIENLFDEDDYQQVYGYAEAGVSVYAGVQARF